MNGPGSPGYSVTDVYAPPMVMFGASITLLAAFGLLEWIIGMVFAITIWSFVQPPIVRWRAGRRARAVAFASLDGLKTLLGAGRLRAGAEGLAGSQFAAPEGDWRAFATDYLVDPIDYDSAQA